MKRLIVLCAIGGIIGLVCTTVASYVVLACVMVFGLAIAALIGKDL